MTSVVVGRHRQSWCEGKERAGVWLSQEKLAGARSPGPWAQDVRAVGTSENLQVRR